MIEVDGLPRWQSLPPAGEKGCTEAPVEVPTRWRWFVSAGYVAPRLLRAVRISSATCCGWWVTSIHVKTRVRQPLA